MDHPTEEPPEPWPPFSEHGRREFDRVVLGFRSTLADDARRRARLGGADAITAEHVRLATGATDELPAAPAKQYASRRPAAFNVALFAAAAGALAAAFAGWPWANVVLAAVLLVLALTIS